MANLAQVGHLLDIPLEVEAVVQGCPLRAGELARSNGRRMVRRVNFKGKN